MTATIVDPLEQLAAELHPPCEAGFTCGDERAPAAWIVHFAKCCPAAPPIGLWCTECKDLIAGANSATCCGCGKRWVPALHSLILIEPLNRRPQ